MFVVMKKAAEISFFLLICLTFLFGCGGEEKEELSIAPEPGTASHFYLLGLDTSDFEKKLELYNKGLDAVKDKRDTSLVALLDGKIYAFSRLGKEDSLNFWIDSLISAAEFQEDLFYQAKGYYRKSFSFQGVNPEEQFRNAYYSRNLYLKYGDTSLAGRRSLDMANAQLGYGDFAGSQESAIEALKFLDAESDPNYVSSAYNVLGLSYGEQKLYSEALKEYNNALKFAVNRKDSLSYLHNIALLHKNQGNYSEATKIFREITNSDEASQSSQIRFKDNFAFMKWIQDSTCESADEIMLEALKQRQQIGDLEGTQSSYSHLSDFYRNKDPDRSRFYAEKYLEVAKSLSNPAAEVEALGKLIPLSDGSAENEYVQRYLFLSDSLKEANLRLKYQFAKIRFDEERKEQQISLLQAENLTQSLRSEKLRTSNIISSLTALLILLFAVGLYYYFRQRGRREKVKQIYLTESRISRRIHDELANDIYHVMSSLETVAPMPMIDKLERIYQRTRDFSRENSEIVTGAEFLKGLLNMLSGTVPTGTKLIIRGEDTIKWNKLEPEKKIVVYRVLQEMMINMKKHSKAKLVALVFSQEGKQINISYSDNGVGAEPKIIENGNGIKNLKDRLKTIKGKAIFETEDKGVKAEFYIPFNF